MNVYLGFFLSRAFVAALLLSFSQGTLGLSGGDDPSLSPSSATNASNEVVGEVISVEEVAKPGSSSQEETPDSHEATQGAAGAGDNSSPNEDLAGEGSAEEEKKEEESSPYSKFYVWNPLQDTSAPKEEDALKNKAVPDDLVEIPNSDKIVNEAQSTEKHEPENSASTGTRSRTSEGSPAKGPDDHVDSVWDDDYLLGDIIEPGSSRTSGKASWELPDLSPSRLIDELHSDWKDVYSEFSDRFPLTLPPRSRHSEDLTGFPDTGSWENPNTSTPHSPSSGNREGSENDRSGGGLGQDHSHRRRSGKSASGSLYPSDFDWKPLSDNGGEAAQRTRDGSSADSEGSAKDSDTSLEGPSESENGKSSEEETAEQSKKKTDCKIEVGGVLVDLSYIAESCAGVIEVPFKGKNGTFSERKILLQNQGKSDLTVVLRTAKARVTPRLKKSVHPSALSGPSSFLQEAADEEKVKKRDEYVEKTVKDIQRHLRKEPGVPVELVVAFASPLDGEEPVAEGGSFMQSDDGALRMEQACTKIMESLKDTTGFKCDILEAVDMLILRMPPDSDLSPGGEIAQVLTLLLELEGQNILFWEVGIPTSLQMLPVDQNLPEPVKKLVERPAFVQAKQELNQQCAAPSTAELTRKAGMPTDPDLETKLWGLYASRCVHAWFYGEKGHKDILVGVVDSGVSDHPDLKDNMWKNPNELPDGEDNDNNGLVDDVNGWNFAKNTSAIVDGSGHGTHVAGTIGAVANGMHVVGCAPLVTLINIQHLDENGKGELSSGVRGIAYAISMGASIVNNSWASTAPSDSLKAVMERAGKSREGLGALIVNAAGNEGRNNDRNPTFPSSYDLPHSLSVGAFNVDLELAAFSNYGAHSVHTTAPGENIYSTCPTAEGYCFLSGTSMATPHVSGVAALVFAVFHKSRSQVTAAEVRDILEATQRPLSAAKGKTIWGGAVDAMAAVLMARMGGMWCQMKCTDMIVKLKKESSHVSSLLIRGYAEGDYSANLVITVYDGSGKRLDQKQVPFTLKSSNDPKTNDPSDEEAAAAFSSYATSVDEENPLCEVQFTYIGSRVSDWPPIKIAAFVLGGVAILFVFACFVLLCKCLCRKKPKEPKKKAKNQGSPRGVKAPLIKGEEPEARHADSEMFLIQSD